MLRIIQILVFCAIINPATGQIFYLFPSDAFKGEKPLTFRQILPTTKGTVLLATSFSNLGEVDKMQVGINQPSHIYDHKGVKQSFRQEGIHRDLYELFSGIKLIAEGPGKIIYVVSDNNHIGAVSYLYKRSVMVPPFIFPEAKNKSTNIKNIWIDPQGDLYIATNLDTLYIVKDAANIVDSNSAERPWLNYDSGFDKDSNIIITKGEKKIEKVFLGKGIRPCSFLYDQEEDFIWVGTNYGLYAYDKKNRKTINKIPPAGHETLTITDFEVRSKSTGIWFSTLEKGLGRYSLFSKSSRFFSYKKNIAGNKNIHSPVLNFCRKSENEFFIAAGDSLPAVFNTDNETYSFINDSAFSETPNKTTSIELDANGSLYIIKGGGFFWTKPGKFNSAFSSVKADSSVAPVLISDVLIGGINYNDLESSHGNYEQLGKITLAHNENDISLLYTARGFSSEDTIVFAYKLEGFENDWTIVPYSILDERMNMADYSFLKPGTYTFRVKVKKGNEDWRKNQAELVIVIKSAIWQTWWFWSIVVAVLILLIFFIVKLRVRSVRKAERQKAAYEKQLLEFEAKALRAQMNPHFIFNCMNSIKSLMQEGEIDKGVTYLTTFSKLIRTLFNNADKKEISLYDEIETCKLYLQLEAMRFDARFSYTVNVDDQLDLKSILIPALIIQPFIENAIWHGIVPKDGGGNVSLNILKNNGAVEIIIDDDGIGREASKLNKAASNIGHQSKGVNLTQSRLELDNLLQQRQAVLETVDKKDADGKAAGTKVTIRILQEE
jgi:hypothetical protein